jgi:hypothetical protein
MNKLDVCPAKQLGHQYRANVICMCGVLIRLVCSDDDSGTSSIMIVGKKKPTEIQFTLIFYFYIHRSLLLRESALFFVPYFIRAYSYAPVYTSTMYYSTRMLYS